MDEIGDDGLFRHAVPVPTMLRFFFAAVGLSVIVVPTWELYRGVWPLNLASPFFLFLILGAWSVGGAVALAGLTGSAALWIVGPGRIVIERKRPFRKLERDIYDANDALRLDVVEKESMEGDKTWIVILAAPNARRAETRPFQTRAAAEQLLASIEAVFAPVKSAKPLAD